LPHTSPGGSVEAPRSPDFCGLPKRPHLCGRRSATETRSRHEAARERRHRTRRPARRDRSEHGRIVDVKSDAVVTTSRLTLRLYRESDLGRLVTIYPQPEVAQYLLEEPWTVESGTAQLERRLARTGLDEPDGALSLVTEREGSLIGKVALWRTEQERRTVEVGWRLDPEHGGGAGSRARQSWLLCSLPSSGTMFTVSLRRWMPETQRLYASRTGWGCVRKRISEATSGARANGPTRWSSGCSTVSSPRHRAGVGSSRCVRVVRRLPLTVRGTWRDDCVDGLGTGPDRLERRAVGASGIVGQLDGRGHFRAAQRRTQHEAGPLAGQHVSIVDRHCQTHFQAWTDACG